MTHLWQQKPEPITDFVGEESADIVIVGAGISGVIAAQSAAEEGASVIVIEKFDKPVAHGVDVGAVNSVLHERLGIHVDPVEAARLMYAWSQQQANYHLIRTFIDNSGEVMSYYVKMAEDAGFTVRLNTDHTARADWFDLDERFRMFQTAHVFDVPEDSDEERNMWNADYLLRIAYRDSLAHGVKYLFNTKAEQILKDGDRVVGVAVSDADGFKRISAKTAVVMATGGISDAPDMLECFCREALYVDKNMYFPKGGNLGEGHAMVVWAGGQLSRSYPAPIIHPINFTPVSPGLNSSWLTVDRKGKRFMNETAYEPIVTNARLNAPGQVAWAIWDADYMEHYQKMEPLKFAALPDDLPEQVEQAVEEGVYKKADTIEELAEQIGVPADNLVKTVARYNEVVAAGDDVDFGVPERFLSPCVKPPFYANGIRAELLAVPFGVRVDDNSQILDTDDEPMPGFYAVGNMQGDFFTNSYPVTCPGSSNGRSVTWGRLIGLALAKGENVDGTPAA